MAAHPWLGGARYWHARTARVLRAGVLEPRALQQRGVGRDDARTSRLDHARERRGIRQYLGGVEGGGVHLASVEIALAPGGGARRCDGGRLREQPARDYIAAQLQVRHRYRHG